ncbi:hypothetical protein [Kitasatospora sp. NPDC057198]|uniref:hypothetical protein n=1 Tax=Kitasatospora sp. NPDC057198 TaxID=3346046 RepID=UPI003629DD6B
MFGNADETRFRDFVQGTWGSFATPAGRVDYIMTKARLGEDSDAPERVLTKNLAPVREVMEAGDLDFDQLLQRDLDDHRVAVKLVPYLLERKATGPAFFPPIVAVLLPFKSKQPTSFQALSANTLVQDAGTNWQQEQAGRAFRVQRHALSSGQLDSTSFGKLWWNDSEAKLVVLDGQHRAMALLAIERTMTRSWQGSPGERFRSFYEGPVEQALSRYAGLELRDVEVPVTVCWFPDETGPDSNPHGAARKLFVDVNKEARPPSKSRIILLSDAELGNVLTRKVLSDLREENERQLPICAVEYDNPETNTTQSARWSALTNIHLLKRAVEVCVFGPPQTLQEVGARFTGGRRPISEMNGFMREQLELETVFPEPVADGGFVYAPTEITNTHFPLGRVDEISDRFSRTWGAALIALLSRTHPYAAHATALKQVRGQWYQGDAAQRLALDALFNGVGVFWTLRDGYEHFQEQQQRAKEAGTKIDKSAKSDVILAWEILRDRKESFEAARAAVYRGSTRPEAVVESEAAFAVFNTHACQLGMALALGSLWELRKQQGTGLKLEELPEFAQSLAAGWNAYFAQEAGKAKDRRLAFNKSVEKDKADGRGGPRNLLNQITNMDTPQAVYFRYFWLQALEPEEAWEPLARWFDGRSAFRQMLYKARGLYLDYCIDQKAKALKVGQPSLSHQKQEVLAERQASDSLSKALKDWFEVTQEEFTSWKLWYGQSKSPQGSTAGEVAPSVGVVGG